MGERKVIEQLQARATSDGAGVKLLRVFGGGNLERFDPFLMLDEFGSEEPSDYIAGFPPHPHRGFETVTYMLTGKMEHGDHLGNVGLLDDGGVQWMTAGHGIIHSEMPKQTEGRMHGFQLWLNLPAAKKMQPARYQDIPAADVVAIDFEGGRGKAIAGRTQIGEYSVEGLIQAPDTEALFLDLCLDAGADIEINLPEDNTTLVYNYQGDALIGSDATVGKAQTLSRLSKGEKLRLRNPGTEEIRFLLLAGKALGEPIVQHGPFVMNSSEEIYQAIDDYQNGRLTA